MSLLPLVLFAACGAALVALVYAWRSQSSRRICAAEKLESFPGAPVEGDYAPTGPLAAADATSAMAVLPADDDSEEAREGSSEPLLGQSTVLVDPRYLEWLMQQSATGTAQQYAADAPTIVMKLQDFAGDGLVDESAKPDETAQANLALIPWSLAEGGLAVIPATIVSDVVKPGSPPEALVMGLVPDAAAKLCKPRDSTQSFSPEADGGRVHSRNRA